MVEPSEDQRKKIAQLEAGEAADIQAVADFKLRKGGGEAAVRLDKLKQLRAVADIGVCALSSEPSRKHNPALMMPLLRKALLLAAPRRGI